MFRVPAHGVTFDYLMSGLFFSKSFFSKVFLQDFFCFVTRVPRSLIYLQNFDNNMLAHNLFYDLATSHL